MNMNKRFFILGLLIAGLASSSCENELQEEMVTGLMEKTPLSIQVAAGQVEDTSTKALVEGNSLPVGSEIGLRVVQAGKSTYDGTTYENVKSSFDGTKWNVASDVLLSATPGTVYAYYPWKSGVNLTAVPLSSSGEDFMCAAGQAVDNKHPSASLTMNHVMAEVTVILENKDYTGTGSVTGLIWSSASASKSGTLNATNGLISASDPGSVFDSGLSGTNTQSIYTSTRYSFLVVPTKTNAAPTFNITMDGYSYSATGGEVELKSGVRYTYKLMMKGTTLIVGNVTVENWGNSDQGILNPS